jgi:hypothetical protein
VNENKISNGSVECLEEPDGDEGEQINDFGKEMPWYETKGGSGTT